MKPIQDILAKVSVKHNVRILFACETGSRAWGFPSPDSDFDVRFIYMHEPNWYLSLTERKDTIEYMDGDLDVTGWDLRKALQLLKRSNAPLIERFQSPITYVDRDGFAASFRELVDVYYSPTAVFYHHMSLASKFRSELAGQEEIKLKSYFYMIRSLLSCHWIAKDRAVVPMHMEGLMTTIAPQVAGWLRSLIGVKAGVGEKYLYQRDADLEKWIGVMFDSLAPVGTSLGVNDQSMEKLDHFFIKMLEAYADN